MKDLPGALWGDGLAPTPLRCALLHPGPADRALMDWVHLFHLKHCHPPCFVSSTLRTALFKVLAQLEYP